MDIGQSQAIKPKRTIRPHTAALIFAALILFAPKLHVIDLVPDVIAYFLLLYIIAPYAVIDHHLAEAQRYLEHMLLIGAAEVVSVLFIYGFLSVSPQEQPMSILLCCFVFAFFRIKTVFPLTRELCDGLTYLDTRNDGTVFCSHRTRRRLFTGRGKPRMKEYPYSRTEWLMNCTRVFVVASSVLNVLPELVALSYVPDDDTIINMYRYVPLFRGFAIIVALPFCIVWLVRMISFARYVRRDQEYYCRLDTFYARDELLHPERQTQKHLRRTCMLMILFAVFTMDFSVDKINVFPDFIGAFLLIAAFLMLRRYVHAAKKYVLMTVGYALASGVHYVISTIFFSRYNPESILRSERIRQAYIPVQVLAILEGIMLALVMVALFKALNVIIENYTGYQIEGTANYSKEEKLKEEHDALKRGMIPTFVAAVFTVISGPMYVFARPTVEFAWGFTVLIPGIFALLLSSRLRAIRDGIDSRYMLK